MHGRKKGIHYRHIWSVCVAVGIATIPAIVNVLAAANPAKVMVYASVGEELSAYRVGQANTS